MVYARWCTSRPGRQRHAEIVQADNIASRHIAEDLGVAPGGVVDAGFVTDDREPEVLARTARTTVAIESRLVANQPPGHLRAPPRAYHRLSCTVRDRDNTIAANELQTDNRSNGATAATLTQAVADAHSQGSRILGALAEREDEGFATLVPAEAPAEALADDGS
ncbi:MAG: hypothetical protein Q9201_003081 [Fulgogasparrea decipioides]